MKVKVPASGARPRTKETTTGYDAREEHVSVHSWGEGRLREDGGGRTNQLVLLTIVAQIPFRKSHRAMLCQARRADDITHSCPALLWRCWVGARSNNSHGPAGRRMQADAAVRHCTIAYSMASRRDQLRRGKEGRGQSLWLWPHGSYRGRSDVPAANLSAHVAHGRVQM